MTHNVGLQIICGGCMERLKTESAGGVVTAPHALAAEAGVAALRRGGNALEAAVAVAAAIAVRI
jgi:gamma-glutamyltranspeptidase/glutathione hydrolase